MTKDLMDAIRERRSIRKFKPDPVPDATVGRLLEAATLAPSAGNLQPWFFFVIKNPQTRQQLSQAADNQDFVAQAPVDIVVCADLSRTASRYGERGMNLYCLQDTSAAIMSLMLAAVGYGLGTCWVGDFNEDEVARVTGVEPERLRPVAIIPLGYPDLDPRPRPRRVMDEVVRVIN